MLLLFKHETRDLCLTKQAWFVSTDKGQCNRRAVGQEDRWQVTLKGERGGQQAGGGGEGMAVQPSWLYAYDRRCNMHVKQVNTDKLQHTRVYSNARVYSNDRVYSNARVYGNARALCRISFQHPCSPGNEPHSQECLALRWQLDTEAHFRHLSPGLSESIAGGLHIVKYTLL